MAILDYEIGGNVINQDGGEAILNIPGNRTMIVEQLSFNAPETPEIVYGIKNMKELFEHFKPVAELNYKAQANGNAVIVTEEASFSKIEDFLPDNIVEHSKYLNGLKKRSDFYAMFLLHLSNVGGVGKELTDRNALLFLKERICEMKMELLQDINV